MEMNMAKFSEKLVELLELAKKKKNVLEYQEISDFFKDSPLEVDQMEKVFDFLEASGVDVLRITENSGDELLLDNDMDMDGMEDEEEVELDKIDLSVPEGVSIEDPVRMYLKEIGKVSKLTVYDKYAMFLHGNNGLSRVQGDGTGKILVIKDSYANCFVPYLTANYADIDVVDFRNYNFGLDQLIADNDYDQILVLYSFDSFKSDPYLYRAGVTG